ncbi:hypothetical protein [Halobacillus litoralis]|uniref:hypothetical protein n=1 Tax=Halobacillus litoralis TaxID=45668 RepID=UPI001CFD0BF6|nr:hypothetical protein [Halobacillus litoralis]
MKYFLVILSCLVVFLFPQSGSSQTLKDVTYMTSETEKNQQIEEIFSRVFQLKKGEDTIRYWYNKVDLNEDGVPEVFVYLSGPMVCGTGGCSAILLEKKDNRYQVKTKFSLVRSPVIVSNEKTNGWKNLVMYVAGGGMKGAYKQLTYQDGTYPSNPSVQPDIKQENIKGTAIISDAPEKNGIDF